MDVLFYAEKTSKDPVATKKVLRNNLIRNNKMKEILFMNKKRESKIS